MTENSCSEMRLVTGYGKRSTAFGRSFSAHVRWCEHGAPVHFPNRRFRSRNNRLRDMESHISRKTSEIWGTHRSRLGHSLVKAAHAVVFKRSAHEIPA
jgi:hypothetical protein